MYIKGIHAKEIIGIVSIILIVFLVCYKAPSYNFKYTDESMEKCMGVPIISEKMLHEFAYNSIVLDNVVEMAGIPVCYDRMRNCLFVSWNITKNTQYTEITSQLKSVYPNYQLYFMKDTAFGNMADAAKNGHLFNLVAVDTKGNYMNYHLVFTTLPIIELNGKTVNIDDRDREIFAGQLNAWSPQQVLSDKTVVASNRIEWKMRGNTAMTFQKRSYRLTLKDRKGNSENLSLLGMESDDDYILNPMWLDDLKVREKLAITLWNEIAKKTDSNFRMSDVEYCEVFINGSYQGIYLLQKKIEKKYLNLDEEDILFKGSGLDATEESVPSDIFEIVYTSLDIESTYTILENYLYKKDFSIVDKENWIDNQLFMQFGHMIDNRRYKNMYYIVERSENQEKLGLLPWDTDMSFGVSWSDSFTYDPSSVEDISERVETKEILEQYPELDVMLRKRWKELREGILSLEYVLTIINSHYEKLDASGALDRDYEVWNRTAWDGRDTRENLESYIVRRLQVLDEKYGVNK